MARAGRFVWRGLLLWLVLVLVGGCGGGGGSDGPTTPSGSSTSFGNPFTGTFQGTFNNPVSRVTLPMTVRSTQSDISVSGTFVLGSERGSLSGLASGRQMVGSITSSVSSLRCDIVLDRVLDATRVDGLLNCPSPIGSGSLDLRAV